MSALAGPLGISLTAVSQHLQVLEAAGLARTQKLGRVRTAHLERGGLDGLQGWLNQRKSLWERRLDHLGDLLEPPAPEE